MVNVINIDGKETPQNLYGFMRSFGARLTDEGTDKGIENLLRPYGVKSPRFTTGEYLASDFYEAAYQRVQSRRFNLSLGCFAGLGVSFGAILASPSLSPSVMINSTYGLTALGMACLTGMISNAWVFREGVYRHSHQFTESDNSINPTGMSDPAVFRSAARSVKRYQTTGLYPVSFRSGRALLNSKPMQDIHNHRVMNAPFTTEILSDQIIQAGFKNLGDVSTWDQTDFQVYCRLKAHEIQNMTGVDVKRGEFNKAIAFFPSSQKWVQDTRLTIGSLGALGGFTGCFAPSAVSSVPMSVLAISGIVAAVYGLTRYFSQSIARVLVPQYEASGYVDPQISRKAKKLADRHFKNLPNNRL